MTAIDTPPTPPARLRGVLSIHDVEPERLDRVAELLELAHSVAGTAVSLLIVPGRRWREGQIERLRSWARAGFELAGHGWVHRGPPRSLYHRLHAVVISRDQAEHLSRSRRELVDLVERGFRWFDEVGLPEPRLYVPPAWALGRLADDDLRRLPYSWYEVQTGYRVVERRHTGQGGTVRHLAAPLVGFEADTALRQVALRALNGANVALARAWRRPLRVGLHPDDLHLSLSRDLAAALRRCDRWLTTAEAVAAMGGRSDVGRRPGAQAIPDTPSSSPDSARFRASER